MKYFPKFNCFPDQSSTYFTWAFIKPARLGLVTPLECWEKGVHDFTKELLNMPILQINKIGPMQLAKRGNKDTGIFRFSLKCPSP